MAASGIAEHNEARRRGVVCLRKAYIQREQQRAQSDHMLPSGDRPMSTYDQQVYTQSQQGALPGRHDASAVDHQRRVDHHRQASQDYSAKIQNRYSSLDYISQW